MASRPERQQNGNAGTGERRAALSSDPLVAPSAVVPPEPPSVSNWFAELRRRRVFRTIVAYAIAAFAVLQIIEPIMHGAHWPEIVLSYVVAGLAAGFPIVIALAWVFDIRGGRIERTAPAPAAPGPKGIRLALLLAGISALAAAPGLAWYFLFRGDTRIVARKDGQPAGPAERQSIAVLPFVNIGGDKENDYFSDGITEELINALANVDGLRVVSRTAVFALKGRNLDVGQIGALLKVGTLLEGSVRRDGNALRITAQLIKVDDGFHLWSRTYDRELKNVFAVEDEIARSIAQSLKRTLVRSDGVKPPTASTEAHDLYLKGRYFWNKRNLEAFLKAADFFEQAIHEDPGYALAYTGLADAIALRMDYDVVPASEIAPKARAAAVKALEIDPGLAEAHCSLGNIALHEFDWKTGERELRRAIELKPDYATAHQWLAETLGETERLREARDEIALALKADPTAPIIVAVAGELEWFGRNFAAAREHYRRALEMEPTFEVAHYLGMLTWFAEGRPAEAAAELAKITSWPEGSRLSAQGVIDAQAGRRQEALRAAREIAERAKRGYLPPSLEAVIWTALGEKDQAFPLLLKGCALRDGSMLNVKADPFYDGIRSDPRWRELMRCMNLE